MKKALAIVLIVFLSLCLLSANAALSKAPKGDVAYLTGEFVGVLFMVGCLILSIRWYLRLNGNVKTGGRQALAIFLIAFCVWGLLLCLVGGIVLVGAPTTPFVLVAIFLGMSLLYIGGIVGCTRWIRRLRKQEATGSLAASA